MTRTCYRCKAIKPLEEFVKNKNKPEGRGYMCRTCTYQQLTEWRKQNPEKHQAQVLRWRHKKRERVAMYNRVQRANWTPEERHAKSIKGKYKMTSAEYQRLETAQEGKCAICGSPDSKGKGKKLHVDHCHSTLKVRGLVCHPCNCGIGHVERFLRLALLQTVLDYVAR